MEYALNDVHQGGILQFNEVAYRRSKEVAAWRVDHPGMETADALHNLRLQGALEIQAVSSKTTALLEAFARRLQQLKVQVTGNA
jgi:hypothetical protein